MFAALISLTLPAGILTPHDLLTAETTLHAPAGTEPPPQSGRMRAALLVVMSRHGAVDPGVEVQWFPATLVWSSEVDYARRIVAKVRTCPPLSEDRYPPREWFAAEAGRCRSLAEAYRKRACEYRTRADWEPDRANALADWARWFDGRAEVLFELAGRCDWWGQPSWSRPRRLLLAEGWPGW
jgi:hypothetical protein